MAELIAQSPFVEMVHQSGEYTISALEGYEYVSFSVAYGQVEAFADVFETHFKSALPAAGQCIEVARGFCFWLAPDQYMLMVQADNPYLDEDLAATFSGKAYSCLLSDGWAGLSLCSARLEDICARFTGLDITRFTIMSATRTHAHHMPVIVLRLSLRQICFLTPSSFANSLFESLRRVAEDLLA